MSRRGSRAAARSYNGRRSHALSIVKRTLVVVAFTALFCWVWARPLFGDAILVESDLFEYYLPIFLAPITTWSSFEFAGLPAFADPGDFSLYPPHLLFARVIGSWTGLTVAAYVLASCFTAAYVYHLTRSGAASLFAGLAYGLSESMMERVAHLGTLHAFAWLPLILLSLERLTADRKHVWIAVGALAVACCFLAGHPQPVIYTVYVALLYALVGGVVERRGRGYAIAVAAMFALGGMLAAVKALPLVEASLYMERQEVSLGQFMAQSHTPAQMLGVLFPTILHNSREAPLYVGLGPLAFAAVGVLLVRRNWRVGFWLAMALFALSISAGDWTPVARLAFELPLYDKFRVGSRHLFLFAFGAATLAGLGLAAVQQRTVSRRSAAVAIATIAAAVLAGALIIASAPASFTFEVRRPLPWRLPIWNDGIWVQLAIAGATCAAAALVIRTRRFAPAVALLSVVAAGDLLYALGYGVSWGGIGAVTAPAAITRPSVHAVRLSADLRESGQRLLSIGGTHRDAVVPAAWARVWRIPIAGSYGPMLLHHHSELADMGTNGSIRLSRLSYEDTSLDLLAVKRILVQPADYPEPKTFTDSGITWSEDGIGMPIGRDNCGHAYDRSASVAFPRDTAVSEIAVMLSVDCADKVPQGQDVVALEVVTPAGPVARQTLRAGVDIADEALTADPEIREKSPHRIPAEAASHSNPALYVARIRLAAPAREARLVLHGFANNGWTTLHRLTLVAASGQQLPQAVPQIFLQDERRWKLTEEFDTERTSDRDRDVAVPGEARYAVYENLRAQPRAWIASEIVPLEEADALQVVRYSQLPGGRPFDATRTALVDANEGLAAKRYPAATSSATVQRVDDGRITIDVTAPAGGFLVLSETWFPGWRARIGDTTVPVVRTNVAHQGVEVPPGRHTVVFELASTTLRAGAALSVAGLAVVGVLLVAGARRRLLPTSAPAPRYSA